MLTMAAPWHRPWESSRDRSTFALGFSSALVTDVFLDLSRTGKTRNEGHDWGIYVDFSWGTRFMYDYIGVYVYIYIYRSVGI